MQSDPEIATADKLIYRVKRSLEKGQRISFLLGSGVTGPWQNIKGVPFPSRIVELISQRFSDPEGAALFATAMQGHSGVAAYQKAMSILVQCEGQPALNEVIAESVLEARRSPAPNNFNDVTLENLENDYNGWWINPAVSGIATLYNAFPETIGPILTSNFDPLLGIAIKQQGGIVSVMPTIEDGSLTQLPTSGPRRQIIHFHGYWRGTDTLHTTEQITRSRPRLGGDLRRILEETTLVVLGYGGWSDVFMETLNSIISEGAVNTNIMWGFYKKTPTEIISEHHDLIEKFKSQLGKRVVIYSGVDANVVIPLIVTSAIHSSNRQHTPFLEKPNNLSPIKTIGVKTFADPGCDFPPSREYWTGRSDELRALFSTSYKVGFITGIGGQGKSSLAAEFVRSAAIEHDTFAFWDWRDCREEANRMHTNLAGICYRLSKGSLAMENLKEQNEASLIELLFQLLASIPAVFIFDNVDEYIDLRNLHPDRAVGKLVTAALAHDHKARFVFTCRPQINFIAARVLSLPITGFSPSESLELFRLYPIRCSETELAAISLRACKMTDGHPLWLNIIAAQAELGHETAISFMDAIEKSDSKGGGNQSDLLAAQTLGAVWQRLNDKQRILLRGMSEAVCQQTEAELVTIMAEKLNYNGLNKSLKKLRQLNLVVIRHSANAVDSYDLHPLVRRFVRSRYTPEEQKQFIQLFIGYFDSLISKLKSRGFGIDSPLSDFANWSHKIELELNRGRSDAAFQTLHEISNGMREAGHVEEYVRLSELVFSRIIWCSAVSNETQDFVFEVCATIRVLVNLGRYEQADKHLDHLENEIKSRGVMYLIFSDMRTFRLWHQDRFEEAIRGGRYALELKSKSGADISLKLELNLALALRDSREEENVREALGFFLGENSLEDILSKIPDSKKNHMSYYGNIGRCLQFLSRFGEALECYKKSLQIAESRGEFSVISNRAYAYWWIGETFEHENQLNIAAHFYKFAHDLWQKTCPPNARKMNAAIQKIIAMESGIDSILLKSEMEISSYCISKIANI